VNPVRRRIPNISIDDRLTTRGRARHHTVVVITGIVYLPFVAAVGLGNGFPPTTIASNVLVAAMFLVIAASERVNTNIRPLLAVSGLLTASATLVVNAHGEPAAHLVFVFTLTLSTLYRSYAPYVFAICYTVVYYTVAFLAPELVYGPGPNIDDAGWWSIALIAAGVLTSVVALLSWRIDDAGARDREALRIALAEASLRQRQATEIHDTVIQGLAVARYALDAGEIELASESIDTTLQNAKELIGGLLEMEGASLSESLLRDEPADPLHRGDDQ
jgi:signal transduction histidine kinase